MATKVTTLLAGKPAFKSFITLIWLLLLSTLSLISLPLSAQTTSEQGRLLMQQGQSLLQQSKDFDAASRQNLKRSNEIRQSLLAARRQQSADKNTVRKLSQELQWLQEQGSLLRTHAQYRQTQALEKFSEGMKSLWPNWTTKTDAISAQINDQKLIPNQAHNTPIRSVHPGMNDSSLEQTNLQPKLASETDGQKSMTLQPSTTLQSTQTEAIDRSTFQLSGNKIFVAHIESDETHSKQNHAVPLHQIHSWFIVLSDLSGKPVTNATIDFTGHMPGHVHGLPTQPQIKQEINPGVYRVSGLKFQMRGWWVIDFEVKANNISDVIRFNLVL